MNLSTYTEPRPSPLGSLAPPLPPLGFRLLRRRSWSRGAALRWPGMETWQPISHHMLHTPWNPAI